MYCINTVEKTMNGTCSGSASLSSLVVMERFFTTGQLFFFFCLYEHEHLVT